MSAADRFHAARRMPPISVCSCDVRDPDHDRHWCDPNRPPTEVDIDGYGAAVAHLDRYGLTAAPQIEELRGLWRRGGAERRLAQSVLQHWAVSA